MESWKILYLSIGLAPLFQSGTGGNLGGDSRIYVLKALLGLAITRFKMTAESMSIPFYAFG